MLQAEMGFGIVEKGFWLRFSPLPVNYHLLSPSAPHYLFFNGCKTLFMESHRGSQSSVFQFFL